MAISLPGACGPGRAHTFVPDGLRGAKKDAAGPAVHRASRGCRCRGPEPHDEDTTRTFGATDANRTPAHWARVSYVRLAEVPRLTSSTLPVVVPRSVTRYRTARVTSSGSSQASRIGLRRWCRSFASSAVGCGRSGRKTPKEESLRTIGGGARAGA